MAIFKQELTEDEMKKLSEEELKQVDGGLIKIIEESKVLPSGNIKYYPMYEIYDDYSGKYLTRCSDLGSAIIVANSLNCSTEVIDTRPQQE